MDDIWDSSITEDEPDIFGGDSLDDFFMMVDGMDDNKSERRSSLQSFMQAFQSEYQSSNPNQHPNVQYRLTPPKPIKPSLQDMIPRMVSPDLPRQTTVQQSGMPSSPDNLQELYMNSLRKLAASMKRSEITRKEILRQRQHLEDVHSSLLNPNEGFVSNSNTKGFFQGSPTMDSAESRNQVWSFLKSHQAC